MKWRDRLRIAARGLSFVLQGYRASMDCPACGAAEVYRRPTELYCGACQAEWIMFEGVPRPTGSERIRIQATRLAPWWGPRKRPQNGP